MKRIRIANNNDWQLFLSLATKEGWRVPQLESRLFQGDWLHNVRILEEGGALCGFVTAVAHQRSGWVGNLIVPLELRGCGYGSQLFSAAIATLEGQGLVSVWLTASEMGQPLYEKHGFVKVDEIERWVSHKREAHIGEIIAEDKSEVQLREADQLAWGEERTFLLEAVVNQGKAFVCDDTVALLQREPDIQVVGPWYSPSHCPRSNRLVLQKVLAAADPTIEIVADILVSSPVRQLLVAAGFTCAGKNALMVKGDVNKVDSSMMVSLASLGSVG